MIAYDILPGRTTESDSESGLLCTDFALVDSEHSKNFGRLSVPSDRLTVWQGLQSISSYKRKSSTAPDDDPRLADKLNSFYARFGRHNTTCVTASPPGDAAFPPPFIVEECEVRRLFRKKNIRKAAGPDGVSSSTLKRCADQLAPVCTEMFNSSLQLSQVPCCLKVFTVLQVPPNAVPATLNDYRPLALASVVMKMLERLVRRFLKSITRDLLDPLQFAYRVNRSVDDSVSLALFSILRHLDCLSGAFNTTVPYKLFEKLQHLSVPLSLCHWILDFLIDHPRSVKLNNLQSSIIVLSTGALQGCVPLPLLYSLFTNDSVSHHASVQLIKFADNTTVEGLIKNSDESQYRQKVD